MTGRLIARRCRCGRRLWRLFTGPDGAPRRYAVTYCATCD